MLFKINRGIVNRKFRITAQSFKPLWRFSPLHLSVIWLWSSPLSMFELLKDFSFFFFGPYKWIPFLSPKSGLFLVRDTALGLCSMSESGLSARLWKPDNPLMESSSGYCCLYPPPFLAHIWRFIEEEGRAAGACTNMAGLGGNRKGGREEQRQEGVAPGGDGNSSDLPVEDTMLR